MFLNGELVTMPYKNQIIIVFFVLLFISFLLLFLTSVNSGSKNYFSVFAHAENKYYEDRSAVKEGYVMQGIEIIKNSIAGQTRMKWQIVVVLNYNAVLKYGEKGWMIGEMHIDVPANSLSIFDKQGKNIKCRNISYDDFLALKKAPGEIFFWVE